MIAMVRNNGDDFIFTCKETSHKGLYDFIAGVRPEQREDKVRKGKTTDTLRYHWILDLPIRDSKDALNVNWVSFQIFLSRGQG